MQININATRDYFGGGGRGWGGKTTLSQPIFSPYGVGVLVPDIYDHALSA
jgi:hypothetical protein